MFSSSMNLRVARAALCLMLSVPTLLKPGISVAQSAESELSRATPLPDRIVNAIDDERRVVLRGNRHPLASAANDVGRVSGDFRMERMILTFKPEATRLAALERLIAAQHDATSPYFHHWLTPQQYGQSFGLSDSDLQQIVNWLHTHGLDSVEIGPSHNALVFSGVAAQVEEAFHTQIHSYRVMGELHHANVSEPEIPEALASVVAGIVSLHDFRSQPMHTELQVPVAEFSAGSTHYMAPADFATIYDVAPLYQQSIDGSGQTIAIVGRSNINISDVRQFRSAFGLPAQDPLIIVNGTNPGILNANEEAEADLDVEWSGAVARNATIKFVVSASTNSSHGTYLSAQYIVNNNLAPVMSMSFGLCEAALGSSGNNFINSLWQQAAAQGITVFVSSGDSGAAGCDSASSSRATAGRGVNGLCSSPYSVCVGGTEFSDSNYSQYWSSSNSTSMSSAQKYIPETVWNESGSSGLWAGGGGTSTVYAKPSWQNGAGVPADGKRDVPDVSLTAAMHDGYLMVMNGNNMVCGGTSAASPSFAGLMALVVESAGSRQGNANPAFYSLANNQHAGGAAMFHDITAGSNTVPGVAGYAATAGYDTASGLGSVDANVLVNSWSAGSGAASFQLSLASGTATVTASGPGLKTNAQVSVSGGFSGPIAFAVTGLPTGVTAVFNPATLAAPGAGTSALTLTASASALAGTYPLTVKAGSGSTQVSAPLSLTVLPAPTFTLNLPLSPTSLSAGNAAQLTFSTTAAGAFNAAVALSVSGAPAGMTASFSPATIAAPGSGNSTLAVATSSSIAPGTYNLAIRAVGGGITRTASQVIAVPGFTLRSSSVSASASTNSPARLTLSTAAAGGFASALAFSMSGLPNGVTASFSATTVNSPGTGSVTLTLTKGAGAMNGTTPITVSATGGGITQNVNVSLTVN